MPIEFRISPGQRRILTRCFGRLEGGHLLAYYQSLRADPAFDPAFDEIFDLSDVEEADVDTADLRWLSHATKPHQSQGRSVRIAVVAPEDLKFGLSRMYQAFQVDSVNELEVFRTLDEAVKWIDTPIAAKDPE